MRLYTKARVVHDPVYQTYTVYYKRHWYSRWTYFTTERYEIGITNRYFISQESAFKSAETAMQSLLTQNVVLEG